MQPLKYFMYKRWCYNNVLYELEQFRYTGQAEQVWSNGRRLSGLGRRLGSAHQEHSSHVGRKLAHDVALGRVLAHHQSAEGAARQAAADGGRALPHNLWVAGVGPWSFSVSVLGKFSTVSCATKAAQPCPSPTWVQWPVELEYEPM